jgi:TonB-like protein
VKRALIVGLIAILTRRSMAQEPSRASCDSVIAAAKTGDIESGIFLAAQELEGTAPEAQLQRIVVNVGNMFVPPRPFKLSVFSGPSLVRGLRAMGADTARANRALIVTGTYRVTVQGGDSVPSVLVVRRALIDGFDSAAVQAIRSSATVPGVFAASTGSPLVVDLRFTSDSVPTSQRLFSAAFPRMLVKDAAPRDDNPPVAYPAGVEGDSLQANVILRFVVAADGTAEPGTVEVVRAAPAPFMKAAYTSLIRQHFVPATVNGCAVAQQVDYPFAFIPPEGASQGLTRR